MHKNKLLFIFFITFSICQQSPLDYAILANNDTDNDGYTEFREDIVNSVANTAAIFDTNLEHRGVPSTDTRRLVLNINYFEK